MGGLEGSLMTDCTSDVLHLTPAAHLGACLSQNIHVQSCLCPVLPNRLMMSNACFQVAALLLQSIVEWLEQQVCWMCRRRSQHGSRQVPCHAIGQEASPVECLLASVNFTNSVTDELLLEAKHRLLLHCGIIRPACAGCCRCKVRNFRWNTNCCV